MSVQTTLFIQVWKELYILFKIKKKIKPMYYSTLLRLMNTHSVLLIKTKVLLFMHIEMTHRIIAIFLVRKIQHQRGFKINFYQNFHLFP